MSAIDDAFPLSEAERAWMGEVVNYRYRCVRCHHEEDVPEVVIDGFAASANPALQPGEIHPERSRRMPRLVCPTCGGPFRAADGDTPRERSER